MKPLSLIGAAALLALAGACATSPEIHAPVDHVHYSALGADPFWMVTIGDDRIVLTLGDEGGRADGALESFAFARSLPLISGDRTIWESGGEPGAIRIEARRAPCLGSGGREYQDQVEIRLTDRLLTGCGGPIERGDPA